MKTLEKLTDEELAMRYVDGNNRAFDVLLNRTQQKIFHTSFSSCTIKTRQMIYFKRHF